MNALYMRQHGREAAVLGGYTVLMRVLVYTVLRIRTHRSFRK